VPGCRWLEFVVELVFLVGASCLVPVFLILVLLLLSLQRLMAMVTIAITNNSKKGNAFFKFITAN
jgi:hypothetical protein